LPSGWDLWLGLYAGGIGTSSLAILVLAAIILLMHRLIHWEVPVIYLGMVYLLSSYRGHPEIDSLTGLTAYAAFFLVSDRSTGPHTRKGMWFYAILAAVFTVLIRHVSVYPDGSAFAILLAGATVPWMDQWIRPRRTRAFAPSRLEA